LVLSGALKLWRKPKPTKGSCAAAADDNDKEDEFDGDDDDDDYNNNNKSQVRHFCFLSNFYK